MKVQVKAVLGTYHASVAPTDAFSMLNSCVIQANSQDAMLEMWSSCMGSQPPSTKLSMSAVKGHVVKRLRPGIVLHQLSNIIGAQLLLQLLHLTCNLISFLSE